MNLKPRVPFRRLAVEDLGLAEENSRRKIIIYRFYHQFDFLGWIMFPKEFDITKKAGGIKEIR
jgi:hypothetical protein